MKRFLWQLFVLSTLSLSVSIENFGFTVSTPFFFSKNVFLSSKCLKYLLIIHVLRWTWKKFYSVAATVESKTVLFFLLAKKFFRASKNDFGLVDVR